MPEENPRRRRSGLPLILGALVIILGAGGYWAWTQYGGMLKEEPPPPVVEAPPPPEPTTSTYASSSMRISVEYPRAYTVEDPYAYTAFKGKPIQGVKFLSALSGTNLASDSGVSIEQLPRANACSGDIYLLANVRAQRVTDGATTYSVATSSTVSAGNAVEEIVFALASSSPCTAIRYYIHTSVGTTSTTTSQFDRATLFDEFDAIRRSLKMQ